MKAKNTAVIGTALGLVIVLVFRVPNHAQASNPSGAQPAEKYLTAIPQPRGAAITTANIDPGVGQLDPGARNYVLETFTISNDSLEVMVTKTATGPYLAGKEYWATNQNMLGAIAGATSGTALTISGVEHNWPAPTGFVSSFRMQDPVTWDPASAPSGLSWVYSDTGTNTYVCIEFNLSGSPGKYSVSSIRWYLAAKSAPRSGTSVFPEGPKYSLSYANAPALPNGYSWYGVTVNPGS